MQSAASDLPLLEAAAREAGAYAQRYFGDPPGVRSKGAAGPVTDVDLTVDRMLAEKLRGARPSYGWLSEETPDNEARLKCERVFVLDPIDGTGAYIAGVPEYTIAIAVLDKGRAVAGVIFNPATDEMFLGAPGWGATLNCAPIRASEVASLEAATLVGDPKRLRPHRWRQPWPESMRCEPKQSIAYRLALVASGAYDGAILYNFKNEWDIAAGAAIIEAAGGRFTDPYDETVRFNQPDPRAPGVVAAGAALHPLLIERTRDLPDPRKVQS